MHVIRARNVNDAWPQGLELLLRGDQRPSRNGAVRAHPQPVTTVYAQPQERVLLDPARDANPFFHLFEALWMLAGRDDCAWLDQFVGDFSSRFGEEGTRSRGPWAGTSGAGPRQHGAYGRRWRGWFERQHDAQSLSANLDPFPYGATDKVDQLDQVVRLLRKDPYDRQAVLGMWDPSSDLGVPQLRDRPCNLVCTLRADRGVLDLQVFCRSNDAVFGCYGANAVHFSILQEYLAARIGLAIGEYSQISVNLHLYDSSVGKASLDSAQRSAERMYPGALPLVEHPKSFDDELRLFMDHTILKYQHNLNSLDVKNTFFTNTAAPMFMSNVRRKEGDKLRALDWARHVAAPDWRAACVEWLERRAVSSKDVES